MGIFRQNGVHPMQTATLVPIAILFDLCSLNLPALRAALIESVIIF
jgi:hypothetical protein